MNTLAVHLFLSKYLEVSRSEGKTFAKTMSLVNAHYYNQIPAKTLVVHFPNRTLNGAEINQHYGLHTCRDTHLHPKITLTHTCVISFSSNHQQLYT